MVSDLTYLWEVLWSLGVFVSLSEKHHETLCKAHDFQITLHFSYLQTPSALVSSLHSQWAAYSFPENGVLFFQAMFFSLSAPTNPSRFHKSLIFNSQKNLPCPLSLI